MGAFARIVKFGVIPYGFLTRERRPGVIILTYHRVGGRTRSEIDVPLDVFARQMTYLRRHHVVVHMDDLAKPELGQYVGRMGDVVAVTFDDGSRDIYEHAFPVLREHGIPVTIYLTTRYIETQQSFDFGAYAAKTPRPEPLRWGQVREMVQTGLVTVGAHTHNHASLVHLSLSKAREEIHRSRAVIEDRIGSTPRHFSYPWGLLNVATRQLVGEHFATGVRGGSRKNLPGSLDKLALWRRPIQQSDGYWLFRQKLNSFLDGEEYFRQLHARFWAVGRAAR